MSLAKLENLFIEKLTEKYRLTERDLKRAFVKYDIDGSGFLSTDELTNAIHLYLNGVKKEHVAELVRRYDVDHDGTISIEEFCQFLISRNAVAKDEWLSVNDKSSKSTPLKNNSNTINNEVESDSESVEGDKETKDVSYRAKIYLQNLKGVLMKQTLELRKSRNLTKSERLSNTTQLVEGVSRNIVKSAFASYLNTFAGKSGAEYTSFKRVLEQFRYPGAPATREDVIEYLFRESCDPDTRDTPQCVGANVDRFLDIMFDKGHVQKNKFGFTHEVEPAWNTGRPVVERGPVSQVKERTDGAITRTEISDVPQRFVTRKCRTSLAVPSEFDMSLVTRSAQLPKYSLSRANVIGFKSETYSNSCIHSYPLPNSNKVVYASAALGIVMDIETNSQEFFEGHTDDITCIALAPGNSGLVATGQLGKNPILCIWDCSMLDNYESSEFDHHYPIGKNGIIAKIGEGFFKRSVCAVTFSPDSLYVCAIGSDDKHHMGIWDIGTCKLIADVDCHSGTPPAIRTLTWSPCAQFASYIDSEYKGPCDVLCTGGERHLRFWAFVRPQDVNSVLNPTTLPYRSGKMDKLKVNRPKTYLSAVFVPCAAGGGAVARESGRSVEPYDIVTGGDNGYVQLWRKASCIASICIFPNGNVNCLYLLNAKVICGGSNGEVAVLQSTTLQVTKTISVLPPLAPEKNSKNSVMAAEKQAFTIGSKSVTSVGGSQRAQSAGRSRPGTPGSAIGTIRSGGMTPRSSTPSRSHVSSASTSTRTVKSVAPKQAWDGPRDNSYRPPAAIPPGSKASTEVLGIALMTPKRDDGDVDILCVTGFGKIMKSTIYRGDQLSGQAIPIKWFHYGPVWAVASFSSPFASLCLSGGDDKWLCLWDRNRMCSLECRTRTQSPIRCIDVDVTNDFVAVGMCGGFVSIYFKETSRKQESTGLQRTTSTLVFNLREMTSRKDCEEDISDVKFSPDGHMLAVGSHDNYIDIYATTYVQQTKTIAASFSLRHLKRCRGHTSYVTHLDWSEDNRLIRSTCGAYELMYWDVSTGKQSLSSYDTLEADTEWHTHTCVLGFHVMGIWPKNADGTDVNSIDVSKNKKVIVVGDDFGNISLFNFPCIAKNAQKRVYGGHSSHVMNIKFASSGTTINCDSSNGTGNVHQCVLSGGGNDNSVMVWNISNRE